ncbi:hypothetical protein, partial [Vibrio cidicii]|uniref:hypothetical protein n=1 Tax=Vibrio cidicii TaxID=1763883 RepID=UPI0037039102
TQVRAQRADHYREFYALALSIHIDVQHDSPLFESQNYVDGPRVVFVVPVFEFLNYTVLSTYLQLPIIRIPVAVQHHWLIPQPTPSHVHDQ